MFVVNDWLDALLLGSFFFGLIFSALSLILGVADIGFGHGAHVGHDAPGGHHVHIGGHESHDLGVHDGIPPVNVSTVLAFLTWFGGVTYLARHGFGWIGIVSLALGIVAGLAGAYVLFWVLRKLSASEGTLDPRDYRIEGTIGRVTAAIRPGGIGEVVYKLGGTWQSAPARAADGVAIGRDTEVVILRRAGGMAMVQTWDSFVGDEHADLASLPDDAAEHARQITGGD
jgi:membrane protein implicated in regulation of membrane protease activity